MISKAKLKEIKSFQISKKRKEAGVFIAEGAKVVSEFLDSNFEILTILGTKVWMQTNFHNLKKTIEIIEISEEELSKISLQSTPNQVFAIIRMPEKIKYEKWNDLSNHLTLVLDTIQDPGNMGAIIRIADWFGIKRIFSSDESVDFYNPKVVQSAMGSIKRVELFSIDLDEFFQSAPAMPVYGALLNGQNLYQQSLSNNAILVIGNESKGISKNVQKYINFPILIPFFDGSHAESLNASVATGIIIAEFRRQIT